MARSKQRPVRREPEEIYEQNGSVEKHMANGHANGRAAVSKADPGAAQASQQAGLIQLAICVLGIYGSFLTWAVLQEQITTTSYGPTTAPERWHFSIVLNTVQSAFAALTGSLYLWSTSRNKDVPKPIFPSRSILGPLVLVAITQSLASPFGYASLKYIDYITFILAKSCKLLPVMFLHLTIFRRRYPFSKYVVITLVTLGVAIFTLHHPSTARKALKQAHVISNGNGSGSFQFERIWGLFLLGINLLFDGLTNSTQDYIFGNWKGYTGPQMMCAQNILSTVLTTAYLVASPALASTIVGSWLGMEGAGELGEAIDFVRRYPSVGGHVLGFAACGAVGQVFIYATLSKFGSLLLVTVTVTRKMLTMLLSVFWFNHKLQGMQWLGVGLVFGGIGAEGAIQRREKKEKERRRGLQQEKKGM